MIRTANLTVSISRNAGGLFESVRRLVQCLVQIGMDVHVLGIEDEFTQSDLPAWSPVNVKTFRPVGPAQFGYSPRFYQELSHFAPDIIHTHGVWLFPSIATNRFSQNKHAAYVVSAHGMLDPWAIRNSRWKKTIAYFCYERPHLRNASCLRALCESEARSFRQLGMSNPIAIIPNGVDIPAPDELRAAENQDPPWVNHIERGRKILLFLGRIHPKKGLPNLIQAWSDLHKSRAKGINEWTLAIAGWDQGGHETEIKSLASGLGLVWHDVREPRICLESQASLLFLGPQFRAGKASCYAHCTGFVLPSFSEGVPMAVLEAWAFCRPVIMTPECNVPEAFTRMASIRTSTEPKAIAESLRELFAMTEFERLAWGTRGKQLVGERFSWPRVAAETSKLYDWILGGGTAPSCLADF